MIDNVLLGSFVNGSYGSFSEISLYQPKRSTNIPEGVTIIGEYMLMADPVPVATAGQLTIGKGVRRLGASREVFYDDSVVAGSNWTLDPNPSQYNIMGGHVYSGNGLKTSYYKIQYFGGGITVRRREESVSYTDVTVYIDDYLLTTANFPNLAVITLTPGASFNSSTGVVSLGTGDNYCTGFSIQGIPIGKHALKVEANLIAGKYISLDCIDIHTPVHRVNHYQAETHNPYYDELCGGGDGINNDDLLVGSKLEGLEGMRRPNIIKNNKSGLYLYRDAGHVTSAPRCYVFNHVRGGSTHIKGVIHAPATGGFIIKKRGIYRIIWTGHVSWAGDTVVGVFHNDVLKRQWATYLASDRDVFVITEILCNVGDLIVCKVTHVTSPGGLDGSGETLNNIIIVDSLLESPV